MLKNLLSKSRTAWLLFFLNLCIAFGCFAQVDVKIDSSSFEISNNKFAENYLRANYSEGENICFSPLALSSILIWLQNGAIGQTKEEIRSVSRQTYEVMHISELSSLIERMTNSDKIRTSNALWVQAGLPVTDTFIHISKRLYAHVEEVDFTKSEYTARHINEYISDQTNQKVIDMIKPEFINKSTQLALTNTLYFKNDWNQKFDIKNSFDDQFYTENSINSKVSFMKKENEYCDFFGNEDYIGVSLPFKNQDLSLLFILPQDKNKSIFNFLSNLDFETINTQVQNSFPEKFKEIVIPKFKSVNEIDLKKTLMNMGMILPFTSNAEFNKICKGLYIDKAIHKTIIEVNETGAEIASASAVTMRRSIGYSFILNRPFLYALYNKREGLFIVVGIFNKPE